MALPLVDYHSKNRETRVSLLPILFLELSPICLEDEENLLEDNDKDDPRFSSFIQPINQNTTKALQLYDEYCDRELGAVDWGRIEW